MRLVFLTLALWLALGAAGADIRLYTPAPADNTGVAVVVCPGGSYAMVSMPNEGEPVGESFASHGITDRFDYLAGAQQLILDWITHLYNE